ncbi:TRAFAC clade GTPase domain-containing protein [Janibacter hoylei]
MAKYPRVRQQNIAVFGESGSGKTVLVSSFYGRTQEATFQNDTWDLVADKTGQGNRLLQNYLGMRNSGAPPMTDHFSNTTYDFLVKLKTGNGSETKTRPFDQLRLSWHDYPGEWFEDDPSSEEEGRRRIDTFRTLLSSDVALLLIDGQKLLDHQGQEERYLKSVLGNFRQNLTRLKDGLLEGGRPLVEFPRIWIISLSKADLFPDWSVNTFRELVVLKATDDVERLRSTIADLIVEPEALSIGEDFLLLSSAKFEIAADDNESMAIDVSRRVGLDLVLPIASILPLERRVLWEERMKLPRQVLDSLADGADVIAQALAGQGTTLLQSLQGTRFDRWGTAAARALPVITETIQMAGPKLKEMNEDARSHQRHLQSMLTQFKLDLEQGVEEQVLRTQK